MTVLWYIFSVIGDGHNSCMDQIAYYTQETDWGLACHIIKRPTCRQKSVHNCKCVKTRVLWKHKQKPAKITHSVCYKVLFIRVTYTAQETSDHGMPSTCVFMVFCRTPFDVIRYSKTFPNLHYYLKSKKYAKSRFIMVEIMMKTIDAVAYNSSLSIYIYIFRQLL